jgi:hypothetical protein
MNQDEEYLKLLSIFHYVLAGFTAFFALFPIIYVIMGLFLMFAPTHFAGTGHQPPPPTFVGLIFVIMGGVMMAIGWTFAALIFAAGRFLTRRKHHTFCLVVACIECLFMPFGTILGIFSIILLMRESVKQLFIPGQPA